ncbi:hypothetical protein DY000_02062970 [Brassica cretica]|uniref:Uncharacterized protein n=1 Tax=Brassica cretica TaxID=69181 RepID=A0ABQ7AWZ3_BRACR|nr:hypothetical protein DY000_02062970 [Brassica cretica]
MEKMREFQRQLSDLKKTVDESEQKRLNLEKTVYELSKKKAGIKLMVCLSLNRFSVSDSARNCCKGFKGEWRSSKLSVIRYLLGLE